MFKELQKRLVHCMIKSKLNESSNYISISIKIMLEMNLKIERRRKAWKKIDVDKFMHFWRDFVAFVSLNRHQHVEKYAIRIRQSIKSAMNIALFWNKFFIETKFLWNDRCVDVITTIKRKRRKWITKHSTNVKRDYLRVSNEKKKIINEKKWNFVESFELFVSHRRNFNISFVERSLKIIDQEKYQKYLIWFAEIRRIMFLNTRKISIVKRDFWSSSFFWYDECEFKRHIDVQLFEHNQRIVSINRWKWNKKMIKRCKLNNASKSNDISNRVLKILVNKLISHFLNLFRVCAKLNYHSLCFRKAYIIALKKSKKKNYTNIITYKSIVLLNTFDKALKSIIAQRINDFTKTHDLLSIN
jgi:hypothetical protein